MLLIAISNPSMQAAVIGGIVGGIAGFIILLVILLVILRRRGKKEDPVKPNAAVSFHHDCKQVELFNSLF